MIVNVCLFELKMEYQMLDFETDISSHLPVDSEKRLDNFERFSASEKVV
jgi:hypothetical protein